MPIINEEFWNEIIKNNTDPYGSYIVNMARYAMEYLDEHEEPLHFGYYPDMLTSHGILCKADEDLGNLGATGAQAGYAVSIVSKCHSRGEEFYESYHKKA